MTVEELNSNIQFATNKRYFIKKHSSISLENKNNKLKIFISKKNIEPFYIFLDTPFHNKLENKDAFKIKDIPNSLNFSMNVNYLSANIVLYIQFFDNDKKISQQSYKLKKGFNSIDFYKENDALYIKFLFRIEAKEIETITFSDINIKKSLLSNGKLKYKNVQKIKDANGRELSYKLNLCEEPYNKPLLVILHGHGAKMTNFHYPNWNILSPLDNFGYRNQGCWWLGEDNDFFLRDLLQELIKKVSKKYNCEIYFYGSSMGGYVAILHGILANAKMVYANVPQIVLKGSTYFTHYLTRNINKVINSSIYPLENNLINFLSENSKKKSLPVFMLCENMLKSDKKAYDNYLEEHTLAFANKCIELNIPCHVELLPQTGHTKNYGLKEVVQKFERIEKFIKENNESNS